jgi:hypothetical protein
MSIRDVTFDETKFYELSPNVVDPLPFVVIVRNSVRC